MVSLVSACTQQSESTDGPCRERLTLPLGNERTCLELDSIFLRRAHRSTHDRIDPHYAGTSLKNARPGCMVPGKPRRRESERKKEHRTDGENSPRVEHPTRSAHRHRARCERYGTASRWDPNRQVRRSSSKEVCAAQCMTFPKFVSPLGNVLTHLEFPTTVCWIFNHCRSHETHRTLSAPQKTHISSYTLTQLQT